MICLDIGHQFLLPLQVNEPSCNPCKKKKRGKKQQQINHHKTQQTTTHRTVKFNSAGEGASYLFRFLGIHLKIYYYVVPAKLNLHGTQPQSHMQTWLRNAVVDQSVCPVMPHLTYRHIALKEKSNAWFLTVNKSKRNEQTEPAFQIITREGF